MPWHDPTSGLILFDFFILEPDFFISIIPDFLLICIFTMSVAEKNYFIVLAISCMETGNISGYLVGIIVLKESIL
jgi:hypothetical protein